MDLFSSVRELHGVGPARAAQLEKLGIRTLYDLLAFFPRDYEDRTNPVTIAQLQPGVPACFRAMVVSQPVLRRIGGGQDITKLIVADETGKLTLSYFNQPYVKNQLHYGESYYFYGALQPEHGMQMANPAHDPADRPGAVTNRLLPVYSLTAGLSNRLMTQCVQQALTFAAELLPEILPEQVRREYDLCGVTEAYTTVHQPPDWPALQRARKRLVFEEFFIFSAGLAVLRASRTELSAEPYAADCMQGFYAALPFRLTGAQQRAIRDVLRDMASGRPMNRLVQGDVGSGKTMIAAAAAFCAAKNGLQTAFLVPTEILARQHFASLRALMSCFSIETVLLTGSMPAAEKRRVKEAIASGEAKLILGTHALLSGDVAFQSLGLVIADEQHRFGVGQRAALAAKGRSPHLLVMSATPIPRTLALIAYGDLDISVVDELPPGRQTIDTFLVGERLRQRVHAFLRRQCAEGGQAYIVCPAIEEGELESLKSAEVWAQTLQSAVFPDLRVGLLHGRMKGAEKDAVMSAFARHELDILVSTTVIEVGVDVPNANVMVIENADRFGLSQLHQLRGRVGRGERKSYCILFTSSQNEETLRRLKALASTNDGFKIAEEDLKLRGPGDFFGSRQHGLPLFKAANLQLDMTVLSQAQRAAEAALHDPGWRTDSAFAPLRARIDVLFDSEPVALN